MIYRGILVMTNNWEELIKNLVNGSVRSLARLITKIENRESGWLDAMKTIHKKAGKAHVIGVTGAPGAGKSTLTDKLTGALVKRGHSVGVIAVDPSSPFSGGALLGDRLRMGDACALEDVFVRSMATRGALGGLSLAARDIVKVMDAFGKDFVVIETVGVGQDEVDVVKTADTVMVVCIPGMGDGIQAIKAGIMEIADIFVVNKADREGADRVVVDIQAMLDMSSDTYVKNISILKTVAATGEGVDDLVDALMKNLDAKDEKKDWNKERAHEEILTLVEREVARYVQKKWQEQGDLDAVVDRVLAKELDPYTVVEEMVQRLIKVKN